MWKRLLRDPYSEDTGTDVLGLLRKQWALHNGESGIGKAGVCCRIRQTRNSKQKRHARTGLFTCKQLVAESYNHQF